ncbi:MAG: HAMP domain-containing methyl-accepting chemotaxis protein, partial [Halobacteriota archaeon]|nr:HAMP domain-containing methyl-accepting chemotaxis protein [Halobacteriota archaeon]
MLDQIMGPIKALSEASVVASGDLSHNIVVEPKGDMNQLVNSFRLMVEKLQEGKKLEDEVRNTNESTKKAKIEFAEKLMGKAQLFASNAEELSASSEDVTASSQEMASVIMLITNGAQTLVLNIEELEKQNEIASKVTEAGAKSARSVEGKMCDIAGMIGESACTIRELGESSKEIVKIIDVIRSISEQTNMLALNAAVDAARAGDTGRGFAVVAEEVGKLAGKSAESTEKIEEVINTMKERIDAAVKDMDENVQILQESGKAVADSVESFEEIPVVIEQMNKAIDFMSRAAQDNA